MSPRPDPLQESRLDTALEDQFAGRTPPDLSRSVLEAAGVDHAPSSRWSSSQWWMAALVVLGLAVLPGIYLLQRPTSPADAPAVEPPDPIETQDPVEPSVEDIERVFPETRAELLELLSDARSVAVMVENVYGLPREVPGEAPAQPIPLYGEGARRELGWASRTDEELRAGLESVRTGMVGLHEVRTSHAAARNLDVRIGLSDGRELALAVALMGNTPTGRPKGAPVAPDTSQVVWVTVGELRLEIDERAVREFWTIVDDFATRTHQFDRGIYWGGDLAQIASAKRSPRLRLHEANTGHLQSLGGSTACKHMDLRYARVGGAYAIEQFPNLETLWMGATHANDIRKQPLPSLRELAFASSDEDPRDSTLPGATKIRASDGAPPLFAAFPGLERLYAPGVGATDRDLEALPQTLETVVLRYRLEDGGRPFGDRGIAALAALPDLQHLDLAFCRHGLDVSPSGPTLAAVEALTGASELRHLVLDGWFANRPQAVADDPAQRARVLSKLGTLPNLRHLSLRANPDLTDSDLAALGHPPSLRSLDLSGSGITRSALRAFAEAMPRCRVTPDVTGLGFGMHPVATDYEEDQERLMAWLNAPADPAAARAILGPAAAGARPANFAVLAEAPSHLATWHSRAAENGGPRSDRIRWAVQRVQAKQEAARGLATGLVGPFVWQQQINDTEALAFVPLDCSVGFEGASVRAKGEPQQHLQGWRVLYEVDGARGLEEFTGQHIGEFVPIVVGSRVIVAPIISSPISGNTGAIDCARPDTAWEIYRALQ